MPRILQVNTPNGSIYAPGGGYWPKEAYGASGPPAGVPTSENVGGGSGGLPAPDIPAANYTGAPTYSDAPTGPSPSAGGPGSMSTPGTSIGLPQNTFGFDPTVNWGYPDLSNAPMVSVDPPKDIPGEPQVVTRQGPDLSNAPMVQPEGYIFPQAVGAGIVPGQSIQGEVTDLSNAPMVTVDPPGQGSDLSNAPMVTVDPAPGQPSSPDTQALASQPIPAASRLLMNQPSPGGGQGGAGVPDWASNLTDLSPLYTAPSVQTPGAYGVGGQGGSFFTESGGPGFGVPGGIPFNPGGGGGNSPFAGLPYHPIRDWAAFAAAAPYSGGGNWPSAAWGNRGQNQLSVAQYRAAMANQSPADMRGTGPQVGAGARHLGFNPRPT
jgi:translation initiation factor IF-2